MRYTEKVFSVGSTKAYAEKYARTFGEIAKPCAYCGDTGKEPDGNDCPKGCEALIEPNLTLNPG